MHSRRRPEKSSGRSPAAARSSMHRRFSTDSSTGVPVIGTSRPESGTTKCSRLPPVPGRRTKKATGRAGSRLATGRAAHEGRRPLSVIFYQGTSACFWQMPPPDRERLLRRFGVLYQGGALWSSMTLAENVALPLQEYVQAGAEEISAVSSLKLALVGLAGFEEYYPSEISGGMTKRAGLARAMALDPDVLFFDKPSAGLDPVSSRRLD